MGLQEFVILDGRSLERFFILMNTIADHGVDLGIILGTKLSQLFLHSETNINQIFLNNE